MFSDEDIKKAMGDFKNNPSTGLNIEPFDQKCLTPVGYDLRVGRQGFSWNKKNIIDIEANRKIQIDANDTVVIQTLDTISLSRKVSATVHSIFLRSFAKFNSTIMKML